MAAKFRGSRRERWLVVALLAALGVSASGCFLLYRDRMALKRDFILVDPLDKKGPRDRFYEWRGKAKPTTMGGFGIGVAPIVLRQPFSVEAQIGVFDPGDLAASNEAIGCIEIDEEDLFGIEFFNLCLAYLLAPTAGVQVFNSENDDNQFYPGVYGGTTRIRSDATTLYFDFQPLGASTFDTISTVPFDNPTLGYTPSIGATHVFKGGVIDFQDVRWTSTPKSNPAPVDQVAEALENGLSHLNEGCLFLDGVSPDFGNAGTEVNTSFTYITQARGFLPLLGDPKLERRVGAKIDCMDGNAAKALGAIGDLSVDGAIKRFERSIRCGGEGLATLRNFKPEF
jgi:hypothetical protein